MNLSYLHYDVFTSEALAGNQLAVFLDGRGLSTPQMQKLAREMNFSESTFILPRESPDTDVRMRIFTPAVEMPMAGHATIGSTFALAHAGVIRPPAARVVFGLGVGPTPVDLEWDGSALRFAWMTQLNPTFGQPLAARETVAAALSLEVGDLAADLPIQDVSCGVPYLMVPLHSREAVDRAAIDASAFRRLQANVRQELALFLFTVLPPGSDGTVYSRMFAPEHGVIEDPATGSAAGPLGCYLVEHRLVAPDAATQIVNIQGVAMGRPSRIHVAIAQRNGEIVAVKVGGVAVLVGRGEILI